MALVKCKECGEQVSTKAKNCPKCGAKAPKKTSPVTWAVLGLIIFGVYVSNQAPSPSSTSPSASNSSSSSEAEGAEQESTQTQQSAAKPQWRSFESEDEMSGDKSAYAASPRTTSNRPMEFPYQGTESWIGFGCDGQNEWTYLGFSEAPNLSDTETKDGYNLLRTRVRWDDSVGTETFTQEWGDPFLNFRNDSQVIQQIVGGNSVLVELDWHGQKRAVIFSYTLRGSAKAIAEARRQCSTF